MKAEYDNVDVREANAWPSLRADLNMKYGHFQYEPPDPVDDEPF
jgi:hypothetical protein